MLFEKTGEQSFIQKEEENFAPERSLAKAQPWTGRPSGPSCFSTHGVFLLCVFSLRASTANKTRKIEEKENNAM